MSHEESLVKEAQEKVFEEVKAELQKARDLHPTVHPSLEHSAFVLKEEFAELKHELYKKEKWRDMEAICEEACQVAASAIRMVADALVRKEQGYKPYETYRHAA